MIDAMKARTGRQSNLWISILFFCSGFPALIYQIVWERALFAAYGLNIQSVTLVVSAFMLGLGVGSLVGGALSGNGVRLVALFSGFEFGIAIFGFFSLHLFHRVTELTVGCSLPQTGLVCFALIVAPTVLMGATLPLLAEYLVQSSHNLGTSVGRLYFANTLGSGFACFASGAILMRLFGQTGSVRVAVCINVIVALAALIYSLRFSHNNEIFSPGDRPRAATAGQRTDHLMPFSLALLCSAFCGFVALSYEIIWYRVVAFASGDTAPTFAAVLGSYLFGLAFGSRLIERYSRRHAPKTARRMLAAVIFGSGVFAFAVSPAFAGALKLVPPSGIEAAWLASLCIRFMLLLILLAAGFFGASFPLIAHVAIAPTSRAGTSLSYLYAANIMGSTLGTLLVGLVLMNYLSLFQISSVLLAGAGILSTKVFSAGGGFLAMLRPRFAAPWAIIVAAIVLICQPVFATIYDRLLFKNQYPGMHFQEVVENRSGTIGVTPDGTVFGGGVYDGRFNTDLLHDVNMIVRPFALSAFHRAPRTLLMIGLGSGSWAQVVANHPQLESLTIVEINPGYLRLIPRHAEVASLLRNPKVRILVDDGRRWLRCNRDKKFDVIVMNNTFHWRNHSSNLLSAEFLRLTRQHLNPGGVMFYNTTGSVDVLATGLSVYPNALRFSNALALSDSPLVLDRTRWKAVLLTYVIDGKHVVDGSDPRQLKKLDEIVTVPEGTESQTVETNDELRRRVQSGRIITDDNMGPEWR